MTMSKGLGDKPPERVLTDIPRLLGAAGARLEAANREPAPQRRHGV
jgi:hypothetical protein